MNNESAATETGTIPAERPAVAAFEGFGFAPPRLKGFGPTVACPPLPTPARPRPLPKRSKGRFFVGSLVLLVCGLGGYQVWNSLLRYAAYGTVVGRVIDVAAPWEGEVQSLFVREGDVVRQGQLLMTLDNLDLRQQLAQAQDDLRIAQATLSAEVSQMQWQSQQRADRRQAAVAEYYQTWGTLLQEQTARAELRRRIERARTLREGNIVTEQELDQLTFAEDGQRQKIEKLHLAVEELKKRVELTAEHGDDGDRQLKPHLLRIENLQAQLTRLNERLACREIRAPVNGLVVRHAGFAGERTRLAQPLFSILEEGSWEIVLYLPQRSSESLEVGHICQLTVAPHPELLACEVLRFGDQLEPAPPNIRRHYHSDEKLLPVYLRPRDPSVHRQLRLGNVATLPLLIHDAPH